MKVLGTVKDAATEVPLPGAKISLYVREEELAVLLSDSEGKFRHKAEAQYLGEILVCKVEKAGYEPQKVIQEFEEDEVTLAIKLVPREEEKIELTVNLKDEKKEIKKIKKMSNERPWYGKPEIIIPAIVVILAAIIGGIFVLISSPQLPTTPIFKEIGGDTDTDGDYEISWESSERAISYILQEDRNHSFINPRTVCIGSETKANIYGKSNGGYYYRARACNKAGESEWSSIRKITVMLSPLLTPKPLISVSPEPISFNLGSMSAGETASRTILISNAGGGTLTWSVSDDQLWMTVNPMSGTNSGSVTININTTGMSQGSYSGSITITSNGGSKRGSVNLNIPQPPKLTVTILEVASGMLYITDELNYGSRVSIDRDYKYTEIPSFLQGKTYIIPVMNDKFRTDYNFLKFSVDQEVIVYVAYDDRYTSKPSWLTDFWDTDKDLVFYDGMDKKVTCSLYEKRFPKGEIVFGGNYVEGEGNYCMYTVVVSEK